MTLDHGGAWARGRLALRYFVSHGYWPDIDAPTRFTEWVQWRKLHDRSEALARTTDKLASKALVTARIGAEHVVPTLWSGRALPERPPAAFPFVVKSSHGCHQWRVVRSAGDWRVVRELAPRWMERTYGWWLDEWHYRGAEHALLIEPFIGDADGTLPIDYKIYVFAGRAAVVQPHVSRGERHRWAQYDTAWNLLSDRPLDLAPPTRIADMVDAAERLGAAHDFVRVDFYEVGGQFLFGEFCLYPGSGFDPFRPDDLDVMLGERWSEARQRLASDSVLPAAA